jgi:D-alanyl-D-alanine carboxypeptidase/D-alanyl-D-alanine-endopeptidase (penicillin-binding protein 4)
MVKSIRTRINKLVSYFPIFILAVVVFLSGCTAPKKVLLAEAPLQGAHVGIAIFNENTHQWVDRYQSDKYFTPASNTKIISCYLGMKYLSDSLPGWRLAETADSIFLFPLGDPSFLHPDFSYQPIVSLIAHTKKQVVLCTPTQPDAFASFGKGWSWDDFAEDYQPERARFNIYGNVLTVAKAKEGYTIQPSLLVKNSNQPAALSVWSRDRYQNRFYATQKINTDPTETIQQIPFITDPELTLAKQLLEDTLHPALPIAIQNGFNFTNSRIVKTVATDSLLKIMMNRSDNFFAEQMLLMTSDKLLGTIDENKIIDTLLKTDFSFYPQRPQWADGSGLSRFNLMTPENYVALLQKMESEYGLDRIKSIFAQGGKGSLSSYYKNIPGVLYAKTGTLGNRIAFSGYIITNKGTHLTFSVLVENHVSDRSYPVRHAVENYLTSIMKKY